MWVVSDSSNLVYPQYIAKIRPVHETEWLRAQNSVRRRVREPGSKPRMVHDWWEELLTQPMAPDKLMVMDAQDTLSNFKQFTAKELDSFIRIIEER